MKNDQFEAMLTARQVADFLQVGVSTVRRWSDRGMLQFYRIGSRGDRRYRREDVMSFLHESTDRRWDDRTEQQIVPHVGADKHSPVGEEAKRGGSKPVLSKKTRPAPGQPKQKLQSRKTGQ